MNLSLLCLLFLLFIMISDERKGEFIMKKILVLALALIIILIGALTAKSYIHLAKPQEATLDNGWELILVNDNNFVPEYYKPHLLTLSNGERVDERIYPELQKMFDDMRELGHRPMVVSGYRSEEEQQSILDNKVQEYINQGYMRMVAGKMALRWVAQPGRSEHQLGIAVDINPDYSVTKGWGFYEWLLSNAHKYGFINRYPADKVEITGISNERWHYRYVGKKVAGIIYEENLCLEEYIEKYCD